MVTAGKTAKWWGALVAHIQRELGQLACKISKLYGNGFDSLSHRYHVPDIRKEILT